MKTKNILVISLITNAVLLGTFGYIQTLPTEPPKSAPIVYIVNRGNPGELSTALKMAEGTVAPH